MLTTTLFSYVHGLPCQNKIHSLLLNIWYEAITAVTVAHRAMLMPCYYYNKIAKAKQLSTMLILIIKKIVNKKTLSSILYAGVL